MKRGKKGISGVITTILLILLVIATIIIVWNVVNIVVKKGAEGIRTEALTVNLEIQEAKLWVTGGAEVKVHRGSGKGEITELKFVFEKKDGETKIIERTEVPEELEIKNYDFTVGEINEKIEKVSVVPMFGDNAGMEVSELDSGIEKDDEGVRIPDDDLPQNIIDDLDLASWWKFNGNAEDSIGDSEEGTGYGGVNLNYNDAERGKVAYFDSVNDYINGSDSSFPSGSEARSVSVWVNPKSSQNPSAAIVNWGTEANNQRFMVSFSSGDLKILVGKYNGNANSSSNTALTPNDWNHVVVTFNGTSTINYYLNGEGDGTGNLSGINTTLNNYKIGQHTNSYFFNGTIDDIMIFNKSLSADEIKAIYNNQLK